MASQGALERDLLSCSICLSLLREPKILPCMHRFCESCLNDHMVASIVRISGLKPRFSCPNCREIIQAPDGAGSPSTWASLLKTDFIVKSMVEVYRSKKVRNPCPKHEDKEQELYCFDCSATVCHLCAVISHRGCAKISTVKEAAEERRATWQECLQQIPGLINEALEIEKLQESNMSQVNNIKVRIEKEIKEISKQIHKNVTDEEITLLRLVQMNFNELQQNVLKFTKKIKQLQSFETQVSSMLSSLSDFHLMVEKDVSHSIVSCREQNQVINEDYRRFCEALSTLEWNFRPLNISRANLGNIEFKCEAAGIHCYSYPLPESPQPKLFTTSSSQTEYPAGKSLYGEKTRNKEKYAVMDKEMSSNVENRNDLPEALTEVIGQMLSMLYRLELITKENFFDWMNFYNAWKN